jgi:putative NADPH-quinone reductase
VSRNVLIIDGHPDPDDARYIHALAAAYRDGAQSLGHSVQTIRVADQKFAVLRSQAEYESDEYAESVRRCQDAMSWAMHVVILYPLWLGSMPALLKAFLEQVLRPGFAFGALKLGKEPVKLLGGKSARIVVTMGMPAWLYRCYYRAHSVRSLRRSILKFVGFRRVRVTLIGGVSGMNSASRLRWLEEVRSLGQSAR